MILVPPHGTLVVEGRKAAVVKTRKYRIDGKALLVVQRKQALGIVRLAAPRKITLVQFRRRKQRHLVSESERLRWWPRYASFYYYRVVRVRKFAAPVPVNYPRGPQVFVRKENIRLVR